MIEYRIYNFSSDNHISGVPVVALCETDDAAIAEARKLLNGLAIEVRQAARRVLVSKPMSQRRHTCHETC